MRYVEKIQFLTVGSRRRAGIDVEKMTVRFIYKHSAFMR